MFLKALEESPNPGRKKRGKGKMKGEERKVRERGRGRQGLPDSKILSNSENSRGTRDPRFAPVGSVGL